MVEKSRVTRACATTLAAVVMLGGSILMAPTNVQASSTYRRIKITKTSAKAYYSTSLSAKTYSLVGSSKKLKLRANHTLKNYRKTTWIRSKKATIIKHGKKYLYYYVTNAKNGNSGWTWHKYLKAGKNYQMTNPVKKTSKNYIKAKTGKVYQLNGNNNYMVFGKGTSLSSKKNYKATQKRYVYKKGKRHTYYYVTSSKGVKGWVNSSLVKAGSYKKTTKTVTSKPKATTTNKPVKATKSVNPDKTYNATTLANDVIKELNDARAQITTIYAQPLIYDATLTQIGNERAKQLAADFSHNDSNGNAYVEAVAKKYGIWDTYYGTEDIGTSGFIGSNQQTADSIIKTVKTYEGHWADLTNGGYNKIGVGQYVTPERTMYLAIELGY